MNSGFNIEDIKKSDIWNKKFKDVGETIEKGVLLEQNIPESIKTIQLIIRTADVIKEETDKYLKEKYDLSIAQDGVLKALYLSGKEYMTQVQLSSFVYTSKANMSSLLDRMEKKNLIKRKENINNKREKKVMLTLEGKRIIKEVLKISEKLDFDSIMTEKDAKLTNKVLYNVLKNYKQWLK